MTPTHRSAFLNSLLVLSLGACSASGGLREVTVVSGPLPLEQRPVLAVQATASRAIAPDSAEIDLTIVVHKPDESSATRAALERSQALMKALASVTAGAELSTSKTTTRALWSERPNAPVYEDEDDRATEETRAWKAKLLGSRGEAKLHIARASLQALPAIVEAALQGGASVVAVRLVRSDCAQVLQELRLRALELARERAHRAAQASSTRLGTLYQLKESNAECAEMSVEALSIACGTAMDDLSTPAPLRIQGLARLALSARVSARIDVALVYQLISEASPPSGEAPGEVHLGLERSAEASSREVYADLTLRARVVDADPQAALQSAIDRMANVRAALLAAGAMEGELEGGAVSLITSPRFDRERDHVIRRVAGYSAQTELKLRSKRFAELSRFIALAGQHGATGFDGPEYTLAHQTEVESAAAERAVREAIDAAKLLASSAQRDIRTVTQIRLGTWLSDPDPLYEFLHGAADDSAYGRGAGGYRQSARVARPDGPFPAIEIHPPTLSASAAASLGFAFGASRAAE